MEAPLLDTLVRLASLGASGICIFAIFWIGWLILRTPADASPDRYRALRNFMLASVAIAIIAGATGLVNARFNAAKIGDLQAELAEAEATVRDYEQLQATARGTVQMLRRVVDSKELAAAESRSRELQRDVAVLKDALAELSSVLDEDA